MLLGGNCEAQTFELMMLQTHLSILTPNLQHLKLTPVFLDFTSESVWTFVYSPVTLVSVSSDKTRLLYIKYNNNNKSFFLLLSPALFTRSTTICESLL